MIVERVFTRAEDQYVVCGVLTESIIDAGPSASVGLGLDNSACIAIK
mgnify:CR=1 FL=1